MRLLVSKKANKYTGAGFSQLHLAGPGRLLWLMNELFLQKSFSYLRERGFHPLLLSLPLPHPRSSSLELADGSGALSSQRTHRHAHACTHPATAGLRRLPCCGLAHRVLLPAPSFKELLGTLSFHPFHGLCFAASSIGGGASLRVRDGQRGL